MSTSAENVADLRQYSTFWLWERFRQFSERATMSRTPSAGTASGVSLSQKSDTETGSVRRYRDIRDNEKGHRFKSDLVDAGRSSIASTADHFQLRHAVTGRNLRSMH
jgi:hypothetical protein